MIFSAENAAEKRPLSEERDDANAGSSWCNVPPGEVLRIQQSSDRGLSETEAARRLSITGRNEIRSLKVQSALSMLLAQFKSMIVLLLIGASIVSGMLGEVTDALVIMSIVIINGLIGFFQEYQAEKSIEALKKLTSPGARVRRDGSMHSIPAAEVVPGDIVFMEAGDMVAADARLVAASSLQTIEASLTGESMPVAKNPDLILPEKSQVADQANMVFMGTVVSAGNGSAAVVSTGMQTEMGKIAGMLEAESGEDQSPLQKQLESFGKFLVYISLGLVAVLFLIGVVRGLPPFDLFITSVSLAVAAVPEGLPAIITLALATGVMRMSRRRALVRRLAAVETLGCANVICTDKTGTLTVGEMTVRSAWMAEKTFSVTGEGFGGSGVILDGDGQAARRQDVYVLATVLAGCCTAELAAGDAGKAIFSGDPMEVALLSFALKAGVNKTETERAYPQVSEIPFDSERKLMTVVRRKPQRGFRAMTKGAPDELLEKSALILRNGSLEALDDARRASILDAISSASRKGLRVLAAAYKDLDYVASPPDKEIEKDMVFAGFVAMYDPPRQGVREAVSSCHSAGITVAMITGDHPLTAFAVAHELGIAELDSQVITGSQLDLLSEADLRKQIRNIRVYARVNPGHKLRIVSAWREEGAVVAMTGDGVNDAPALKGADIGIAMGLAGTEVTKQASEIVIADDNFSSIVSAIEEGRGIYDNIQKTIFYLLSGNTGELLVMTACIALGLPVPLLAIHLLWINLVTDGLPALCLAVDPIEDDVMKRKPRTRGTHLADREFIGKVFTAGFLTGLAAFLAYLYGHSSGNEDKARTFAFAALVFSELLRALSCRSPKKPIWRTKLLGNFRLFLVVAVSYSLQVYSHHSPLLAGFLRTSLMSSGECMILLLFGAMPLVVLEIQKEVQFTRNAIK